MSCVICKNPVINRESGIKCAVCEKLYHLASCSKLEPDMIPFVQKNRSQFGWKCPDCLNEKIPSNIETIIKRSIGILIDKLDEKVNNQIKLVDNEVKRCKKQISSVELSCHEEHNSLNNNLQEMELQLYRPNLLISGVPLVVSKDPFDTSLKIFQHLGFVVTKKDISQCFHMSSNKDSRDIFIKFCSINLKFDIMQKYWSKKLALSDVFPTDLNARIYFNDHLPKRLAIMSGMCRKLRKQGQITKFLIHKSGIIHIFEPNNNQTLEMRTIDQLKQKFGEKISNKNNK